MSSRDGGKELIQKINAYRMAEAYWLMGIRQGINTPPPPNFEGAYECRTGYLSRPQRLDEDAVPFIAQNIRDGANAPPSSSTSSTSTTRSVINNNRENGYVAAYQPKMREINFDNPPWGLLRTAIDENWPLRD